MLSLKNDLEMVKEELNSEEKFFEKAVITEKFVKKYKNLMIGSVVAVVVIVGANIAYDLNKQAHIDAANQALTSLQQNAKDTAALTQLKTNSPALYDVWMLSNAVVEKNIAALKELKNSKTTLVGDIATYELAQDSQDLAMLDEYASKQNAIYRDLAKIQAAVILMHQGDTKKAHTKLETITEQSPLAKIAQVLLHYGVK